MTSEEKARLTALRKEGFGYKKIAQELGLSENSVKTFCRRNGLASTTRMENRGPEHTCLFCGETLIQSLGRKEKKFCSRECRNKWWNAHIGDEKRNAMGTFVCPGCGMRFYAYNRSGRKYCSHECYIRARFGGGSCE